LVRNRQLKKEGYSLAEGFGQRKEAEIKGGTDEVFVLERLSGRGSDCTWPPEGFKFFMA
jgi:hypothetical protein